MKKKVVFLKTKHKRKVTIWKLEKERSRIWRLGGGGGMEIAEGRYVQIERTSHV
jgi:hypothetical protein